MVNQSMPNKILSKQNESNHNKNHNSRHNINNQKKVNTDSLDEAMNELLDICQQYNDKLSMKASELEAAKDPALNTDLVVSSTQARTTMTKECDSTDNERNIVIDKNSANNVTRPDWKNFTCQSGSIERLQQKQGEIQAQLDEVLQVAKLLASKQKRKLRCILEDESSRHKDKDMNEGEGEEEDELIEFQQIENELRVSELNRQLDNIQEELRVRLYKRLLSNANTSSKFVQKNTTSTHDLIRRESHTDESSPSSSSCSDEPTTSLKSASYSVPIKNIGTASTNSNLDNFNNKSQQHSKDVIDRSSSARLIHSSLRSKQPERETSPTCPSNHRNNSANSDLERIEEDEEDCQDYYCDSERFRTIYEEKLSPIIYGHQRESANNRFVTERQLNVTSDFNPKQSAFAFQSSIEDGYMNSQRIIQNQQSIYSDVNFTSGGCLNNDSSFNSSSSGSGSKALEASRTSRPLTLYLPKPDEEIDLVDHIQASGHDLSIISSDMKLDSNCACGYLWKCCSNNNKKWLKRYFYFDRSSQTLSYYENEAQLVRKSSSPKNCIHFDEISDVYVDHRLSGIGEKDRSAKKKSYVFVLATTKRKYLLASSRAETMRAWIDTLFTAAKANDYFQHISTMEDRYDDSFDS